MTAHAAAPAAPSAAGFTSGNIVVYRVGDGSAALTGNAAAVFLDEYTPAGVLVQSIPMPTAVNGSNKQLVASGSATSEGLLTRSSDGKYLIVPGYDAAVGTASITSSTTIARVIGRVDSNGNVDTTTALADGINVGNPRSAASADGSGMWLATSATGVRYAAFSATTSTQLNTDVTNTRALNISGNQLYMSTASGTNTFKGVNAISGGLPTTSSQTFTRLAGLTDATNPGVYGFFFADLDAGVVGVDTLYTADDTSDKLSKYSLVGGNWALTGQVGVAADDYRGLTGVVSGTTVTLYATGKGTQLVTLVDSSGYNGTLTGTPSVLATAATNTAFRGVALAPSVPALPKLSISDVNVTEGNSGTVNATFTISLSAVSASDVTFTLQTSPGTADSADMDYVDVTGSLETIQAGNLSTTFDVVVNGDLFVEDDEYFYIDILSPSNATINDGRGIGTILNDDFPDYSLSINDVTVTEGNSGSTTASFTVSLSTPAPVGGVTFDIATSGNSATAGSDYEEKSLTGQTIPAGIDTYTFDVNVYGDTSVEADESFFVNISNVTGATATDAEGIGTITNDDLGLSINDINQNEGNIGTTNFIFTVSLNAPAPVGGVAVNYATSAGTATADDDYVSQSGTATIAEGINSTNITIVVNGDINSESDETFFVDLSTPSGATITDAQGLGTITNDDAAITPIYQIQGSGAATSLSGVYTTLGIVVGDYEGGASPEIRGFYIQDVTGDSDPATSDGIFVFNGSNNSVALGDLVRVTGTVSEYQGQTQISSVTNITVLSSGNTLTATDVFLPLSTADYLERYEGMLVKLAQTLYVTEHFQLGRFGQVVMSSSAPLQQPTNVTTPGAAAIALQNSNNLNRIIVDDALNSQNPDPILFGRGGNPLSASNTLRVGDSATNIVGVMTYTWSGNAASGNAYRVRPVNALGGGVPVFTADNARPALPSSVGGSLKVVGMNTLNYFNSFTGCTNGVGGNSTSCRGASDATEFDRQAAKITNAIVAMDAGVVGLMEIENDGYGSTSALQDLVNRLNAATAPGTYALIDTDTATGKLNAAGLDAIKVALLYKPALVTPVGTTAVLDTVAFVNGGDATARNRVALVQAFEENSSGGQFVVTVNHLKSKGSACTAPDAGDGQGECNIVRTNAAIELANWLAADPTGTGDPDILIIGDLNAYAMEDPITALEANGYINLIHSILGDDAYSYVFDGQRGYLDHALGTASFLSQVSGLTEWHVNADEPSVLDFSTDFKTANLITSLYSPEPYRNSDHDPVLLGLNLDGTAPDVTINSGPANPTNLTSASFTFSSTDGTATFTCDLDGGGFVPCTSPQDYSGLTTGSHTFTVRATDPAGNANTDAYTWTIDTSAPGVSIDTYPANPSTNTNPGFTFSSPDTTATFKCSLDGSAFTTCTSPISYTSLANGSHTFSVRATDPAGNTSTASYTWLIDTIAPDTSITTNPANPTNLPDATFSFTGNDGSGSGIASFECQLDGGAFAACTSPQSYNGLADGSHTFAVRSIDNVALVDASPASYTWLVDATAPDTTITANPANPTKIVDASFSFSSADATATFECSLDGAAFTVCTSPVAYPGLADGSHSFDVRAIDPLGNTDATPATFSWVVDTHAPLTTLTALTINVSSPVSAFSFTADDGSGVGLAGFECQLDGGGFSACASPLEYTTLLPGSHTINVRAIDTLGSVEAVPASITWTVIDPVFSDVPDDFFKPYIDSIFSFNITSGCGVGKFCPYTANTRAQMAVMILRALNGKDYNPPDVATVSFSDVPATHWAHDWIEEFYKEGFTSGCGGGKYCPESAVNRAQAAVFVVKGMYGVDYVPPAPPVPPTFSDTPDDFFLPYIEKMVADGITAGCGGGKYCPNNGVLRTQMAVFLVRAFDLPVAP